MSSLDQVPVVAEDTDLSGKAKKRLFVGLVLGTSSIVCLFLAALWVVPAIGINCKRSSRCCVKESQL